MISIKYLIGAAALSCLATMAQAQAPGQVVGIVELNGVHKNTYHHEVVLQGGLPHQGEMSFVQCTHGHDDADKLAVEPQLFGYCLHLAGFSDDLHRPLLV